MGDVVTRDNDKSIPLRVRATAMEDITEIVIRRNNEVVFSAEPNSKKIDITWTDSKPLYTDHVWYYVRLQYADDELAQTNRRTFSSRAATRRLRVPVAHAS